MRGWSSIKRGVSRMMQNGRGLCTLWCARAALDYVLDGLALRCAASGSSRRLAARDEV